MITTDTFNIGFACQVGLQMYRSMGQQTGRTERMIRNLQPHDTVVVSSELHAKLIKAKLDPLPYIIDVQVLDPTASDPLARVCGWRSRGRAYFDHTWIEQFFAHQVDLMGKDMQAFADRLSKRPPELL